MGSCYGPGRLFCFVLFCFVLFCFFLFCLFVCFVLFVCLFCHIYRLGNPTHTSLQEASVATLTRRHHQTGQENYSFGKIFFSSHKRFSLCVFCRFVTRSGRLATKNRQAAGHVKLLIWSPGGAVGAVTPLQPAFFFFSKSVKIPSPALLKPTTALADQRLGDPNRSTPAPEASTTQQWRFVCVTTLPRVCSHPLLLNMSANRSPFDGLLLGGLLLPPQHGPVLTNMDIVPGTVSAGQPATTAPQRLVLLCQRTWAM